MFRRLKTFFVWWLIGPPFDLYAVAYSKGHSDGRILGRTEGFQSGQRDALAADKRQLTSRAEAAQAGLAALEALDRAVLALGLTSTWKDGTIVPYADEIEDFRGDFQATLRKEAARG